MVKKQNTPRRKAPWRKLTVGILIVLLIGVVALLVNNVSGSTKPIKETADQFKPPAEWILVSENIEPPRFVCLGGNACPSIHRTWDTHTSLDKEDFRQILLGSYSNITIDGDCMTRSNIAGNIPVCTVKVSDSRFGTTITLWKDSVRQGNDRVTLSAD